MSKALSAALLLGLCSSATVPAVAQPMSRPNDLIIRPGDTIELIAPSPHRLRIGGAGLTAVADVDKILTFAPALTPKPGDIREGKADELVTATVLPNAEQQGVASFVFTCGQHPGQMLSQPFKLEAAVPGQAVRVFKIRADDPLKWILERGDVQVDTTP